MKQKVEKALLFLKDRWGVSSIFQVFLILLTFTITGMLSTYVSSYVFSLLGLTPEHSFWLRAFVYIITVLPAYQVILLIVGTLLGQHRFFKKFLKSMLSHFIFWKRTKKNINEAD
jgi:hypothetical protein